MFNLVQVFGREVPRHRRWCVQNGRCVDFLIILQRIVRCFAYRIGCAGGEEDRREQR